MTIIINVLQEMKFRHMFTSEYNIVISIITTEILLTCHCTNGLVLCSLGFTVLQVKCECDSSNTFAALNTCWGSLGLCALIGVCVVLTTFSFTWRTFSFDQKSRAWCPVLWHLWHATERVSLPEFFVFPLPLSAFPFPLESEDWLYPLEFP